MIESRRRPRGDRQASEVVADIGLELLGGAVAARRVLLHRLEDDRVQVTAQAPRELRGVSVSSAPGPQNCDRRWLWFLVEHRTNYLVLFPGRQPVRGGTGQQHMEEHAERINVRRGGDRFASDLLGARVHRREEALARDGERRRARVALVPEQLRDPEVQQFYPSLGGVQNVGGF